MLSQELTNREQRRGGFDVLTGAGQPAYATGEFENRHGEPRLRFQQPYVFSDRFKGEEGYFKEAVQQSIAAQLRW